MKPADAVILPAGRLADIGNRGSLFPAQEFEPDRLQRRFAPRAVSGLTYGLHEDSDVPISTGVL